MSSPIYKKEKVFAILKDKKIFLYLMIRQMRMEVFFNIMYGICSNYKREKTYLVHTVELFKTNNEIITHEIII